MIKTGCFVVSLDFEMMWGQIDHEQKDGYGLTNVKNVPKVVEEMLQLFGRYGVHATFATVGMMMYENAHELMSDIPDVRPSYKNTLYSPYENNYIQDIKKDEECLFFCPELIDDIRNHQGMEIGTHTYCHYYCWADGQNAEQFESDISKAIDLAKKKYGIQLTSIIFPRNEVSPDYLRIAAKYGIKCYRGNADHFFEKPKNKFHGYYIRMCRLLDTYINLNRTGVSYSEIDKDTNLPYNIKASRFLRPWFPKLAFLESLHLMRIKHEIIDAAKRGEMYHIWWHPHNMGADMDKNLRMLESILKCYSECHIKYGMQSYNMSEICELLK